MLRSSLTAQGSGAVAPKWQDYSFMQRQACVERAVSFGSSCSGFAEWLKGERKGP